MSDQTEQRSALRLDFITDEELRASLQADLRELESSLQQLNFKSVHVLAGSFLEALLVDHVISSGLLDREVALKSDLNLLIDTCRKNNAVSARTADLSSVVRSYRNLIHPGRMLRLKETIDASTANVARALVDIVSTEIAAVRLKTYGPTAEQIAAKLERDSTVNDFLRHVLDDVAPREIERLLLNVLPARLLEWDTNEFAERHVRENLSFCFRQAFRIALDDVKKRTAKQFATIIRTGSESTIRSYANAFFDAMHMTFLSESDKALVKAFLFGKFRRSPDPDELARLQGIASNLGPQDAAEFIDLLVRPIFSRSSPLTVTDISNFLEGERLFSPGDFDNAAVKRLERWKATYNDRGNTESSEVIASLIAALDIPF